MADSEATSIRASDLAEQYAKEAQAYTALAELNKQYAEAMDSLAQEEERVMGWIREGSPQSLRQALVYFKRYIEKALETINEEI